MPRLYVYSRVSTLRQMTGHGLTGQDEARERWLADNQKKYDLELVEDYRDLGISGRGKNVTEGKMGLILDGIESGKIPTGSWLAVDSLDRISRDELIEAHYLVSGIIRAGIIIVTIADGMIFDRSEKEKMMFNLLISLVTLARSSNESEAKSFRGLRNWVAKRAEAETGKPMTAMTPAWIDLDESGCLVLNQHAETVRAIFEFAGEGFGTSLIVQKLNAEGRPSMAVDRRKDGGKWSRRYITLILANRSVLGEFRPGRKNQGLADKRVPTGTVIPNYFPPAITPALWLKAQASLADRKPLDIRPRRSDFSNLFAGLRRCVACGEAMTICHRPKPSNLSYLRCPGRFNTKTCTEGRAYSYHALEKAVFDLLPYVLFDPPEPSDVQATTLTEKADCLKVAIERTSTARKKLIERFGFDDEEASAIIDAHAQTLIGLRSELAAVENERVKASQPMPALDDLEQLQGLRHASDTGTAEERQVARARLAQALRSVVTVIGFCPDGSAVLNIQNGLRLLLLANSGGRNATFDPLLSAKVSEATGQIFPIGIMASQSPKAGRHKLDLVTLGQCVPLFERVVALRNGSRANLATVKARIARSASRSSAATVLQHRID